MSVSAGGSPISKGGLEASPGSAGLGLPTRGRRSLRRAASSAWPALAFGLFVLVVWEAYCRISGIGEISLPRPTQIASALWSGRSSLVSNGWTTLQEIVIGYFAAVAIGIGLAVAIHASRRVERALYPWLVASQMVPIPAIAPIFVIWTGFDLRPKVMVIALVSFFPIAVNMIDGLRAAEPELLDLLSTLGASRRQRFRMAQLPAALPFVFSGLKIAAAFSVIGAVFGEWVGSNSGLGYLILTLNNQSATPDLFAVVAVLALMGVGFFALIGLVERAMLPWYFEARRSTADAIEE